MAVQKYSVFIVMFICSCVYSGATSSVNVTNKVQRCVTFLNNGLQRGEPTILNLGIEESDAEQGYQCKSALFKYSVSQKKGKYISNLISGSFTVINKKSVALPVSVQSQLVYDGLPLNIYITCANP